MRILGGRHEQGAGAPAAGWGCDRPRLPPDADSAYARTATMVRRRRHEQGAGAPAAGWGCDRPRLPPDADSAYARTATMVRRRRRVNLLELTRLEVAYGGIRAVK